MTKNIKLGAGERIYTLNLLNDFKGGIVNLGLALEDIKKIGLTEEERKEIEYKVVNNGEGKTSLTWNPSKSKDVELELNESTLQYVFNFLKSKDEKGEFTLADIGIIELKNKLKKVL